MAVLVAGTELFYMVHGSKEIKDVGCITSLGLGANTADEIDTTCLKDSVRSSVRGLTTPGEMSLSININPNSEIHTELQGLSEGEFKDVTWFIGWGDGKGKPTMKTDVVELPKDRTFLQFDGYVQTFSFTFESNNVVKGDISVKRKGETVWSRKGVVGS